MADHTDVFISSTSKDLTDYRKMAIHVCQRLGMPPIPMEDFGPDTANAIEVCKKKVDDAEIYLGIFAHRYGWIPDGHDISITEMEYNWAMERGIPALIFMVDEDAPWPPKDIERGAGYEKLKRFKEKLMGKHVVRFFKDLDGFRDDLFVYLPEWRKQRDPAEVLHSEPAKIIPALPEPYIAHPYILLQTHQIIGRQAELNLLTDWVAKPSARVYDARFVNFVAIGGMGKSALTWKWFNEIAPNEMKTLEGRVWWSFYESDARFENFVIRTLAYVSRRTIEDVQQMKPSEREDALLAILDREPFLLVLDGLERILIAYARMDAARLNDSDYDQATANWVAGAMGLPESAAQSFIGQHRLRLTADPRAGRFLQRLARVNASRTLASTRLYPAELQIVTGGPYPGCLAYFLHGLTDDDAVNLWREFGVSGTREELLRLFHTFENYPLLIRALAGEVAGYRRAPGDFDTWRAANPDFNPFNLDLKGVQTHVLHYALRGLPDDHATVLRTVAGFRMPASYDTLAALLVEGAARPTEDVPEDADEGEPAPEPEPKLFAAEPALDAVLTGLEDRGLLGWDRRANRYDLHPIVRGVVWSRMDTDAQRDVYTALHSHFEVVPNVRYDDIESLDDLTPAIELYNALIGLERYDDAWNVFQSRISGAMLYRLSASRQRAELLEMLFPDGMDVLPRLRDVSNQSWTLNALALTYDASGQPGRAAPLYRYALEIDEQRDQIGTNIVTYMENLASALLLAGRLSESERAAYRALVIDHDLESRFDEGTTLQWLGVTLAARGESVSAEIALRRSLRLFQAQNMTQAEGVINAYLAQAILWRGDPAAARPLADRAWELAHHQRGERDFIMAACRQGEAALGLGDFETADERLHHALARARAVNFAEEELPALVALAELRRRQGKPDEARRDYLDGVWGPAERGPYPLLAADAYNVLAQIECDAGNPDAAIKAATRAYTLAWCDGPPFAYQRGLHTARQHLEALGAPLPDLPPFDESQFEPLPEVEIDPEDKYHAGRGES
ncbi:MAG: DUF4062 domain-containing protein [Anaerolineae bacterium]|nr:DUF4062 domain-containing protein [Anaerolineae bacterium]